MAAWSKPTSDLEMTANPVRWEFHSVFLANGYIFNGCWVCVGVILLYANGLPIYACPIAVLPYILKYRAQPNFIEIDRHAGEIRVIYRRLWRNDIRVYPIARWGRVHSYITARKYPQNVVELLPYDSSLEGLPIGSFDPEPDNTKCLFPTEAIAARTMREKLAREEFFVDAGFSPAGTPRQTTNILWF